MNKKHSNNALEAKVKANISQSTIQADGSRKTGRLSLLHGADPSLAKPSPEPVAGLPKAREAAPAARHALHRITSGSDEPPPRAQPQSRRAIRKRLRSLAPARLTGEFALF